MLPNDLSTKEHVLRSSVFPAMFYGTEIFPVATDQLSKVRTAAAEALVGPSRSMSPAVVLFLTKGGILDPEFVVIAQAIRTAMQWLSKQSESDRNAFYAVAATFQGSTQQAQGPASTLKHYLRKLSWEVDHQGFVLIDGFIKCHLVKDGFPTMYHFLCLAWQQKLILMMTSRFSLFSMPDISRCDTVAILKTFPDSDRRQLLREISGAYQTESQKAHWTEDADGLCPFCNEPDSKTHRFAECAALAHVREPYAQVLSQVEDEGLSFAQMPVIHSHADMQVNHLLHHQQPHAIITDHLFAFAKHRQTLGQPFHIYTDGSCCFPTHPTSRYAAYSGVVDLAQHDIQRCESAQVFLHTGKFPDTLVTAFAARLQGIQSIPRAELTAIKIAASLPYGTIHSDSQYAIGRAKLAVYCTSRFHAMANADLLWDIHEMQPDPNRFVKIKAHRNLTGLDNLLDLYHALGNHMADLAAKHACNALNPEWQKELDQFHAETDKARHLLVDCFKLHVDLFRARAQLAEQLTRQDARCIPAPAKNSPAAILEAIKHWNPVDIQMLSFPMDHLEWYQQFSWGDKWANDIYLWMQQFRWPVEPQGPLAKEIGISWLELAISFSLTVEKCLPILRKNHAGKIRLLMVEDATDVAAHSVTLTDVATTMQKMWAQAVLLMDSAACPNVTKGLQTALYVQGFGQSVSGMSPRPQYPHQAKVTDYVQKHLTGRKAYDCPFHAEWLQPRAQELLDQDWLSICDGFKYSRRASRARKLREHQLS